MKMLRLSLARADRKDNTILMNPKHIVTVYLPAEKKGSCLLTVTGVVYHVRETLPEISEMLAVVREE